jgi:RimJ/RimL family protein N-acetyltransferase
LLDNKELFMLESQRLILRALTRADLPRLCEFNNDIEVELLGGGDPPMPQSLARLEADFDQNTAKGGRDNAGFAIEAKIGAQGDAQGKFIGQCALFHFDDTAHTCELGITIGDRAYWGQGYGREAIRLLLDYAFRLRNMRKVWLTVNGDNERAYRAYRACGFVEEGRWRAHVWSNGKYIDLLCMGLLHDEWEKLTSA